MNEPHRTAEAAERFRPGRARDWLIGAALLAGLLVAVDVWVGWATLLAPWGTVSPSRLLLALVLTTLSYGLRALRVYDFFGAQVRGRFVVVLRLSVLHNAANNLLPMRAGEMLFPWLMRRWLGHGFLAAGVSLLWIRLLDLHVLGAVAVLALWLRDPAWYWLPAGLAWLALLPLTARLVRHGQRLPAGIGRVRRVTRFVAEAGPAEPQRLVRLYLWTVLIWGCKLAGFAVVLRHFLPVDYWRILIGVLGAELSTVLPFHGIAGAGSYELATVAAMVPFGVGAAEALTGAVNLHLFLLGTTLLLASIALLLPVRDRPRTWHHPRT
ncbi:MAG: lysylphosphatidylglycerol synthase transmembrane domain-containing protein [Thiohalocapsa sp.]|jgi:uncharacterized membrane protein YbhN (UPF0104 family)